MAKSIRVPRARALSTLGGVSLVALDHDADAMLENGKVGWQAVGLELVAAVPFKFQGTRDGYLVLLYDRKKDKLRTLYEKNDRGDR
jgi:hypothetical protein